tara:strand:+ start:111 stop:221 length:111 start_codon:yes stop_codon:yes gene_type:complete
MLIIDSQPFFVEDYETIPYHYTIRIHRNPTDLKEFA